MGFQGCCGWRTHLRMERTLRCYLGGEGMKKKGRAQLVDVCRLPNDRQDTGRKEGGDMRLVLYFFLAVFLSCCISFVLYFFLDIFLSCYISFLPYFFLAIFLSCYISFWLYFFLALFLSCFISFLPPPRGCSEWWV